MRVQNYTSRRPRLLAILAALLLFLTVGGCGQRQGKGGASDKAEADRARLEAVLGQKAYISLDSARAVLRDGNFRLLDHQEFPRLEELFAAMRASKQDWGSDTSLEQEMFSSFTAADEDGLAAMEYRLDLWADASDSNLPELLKASVMSQWVIDHSAWSSWEERQSHIVQASRAMSAIHKAGTDPRNINEAEYWESYLRVALFSRAKPERLDELLAEVLKRDPQRWTAVQLRAMDSQAAYGAAPGQLAQTLAQLSQKHGVESYAFCAWGLFEHYGNNPSALKSWRLDPAQIQAGFKAARERYPNSRLLLSRQARMAVLFEQKDEAGELLQDLGEDWDASAFDGHSYRDACGYAEVEPQGALPARACLPVGPERDLFSIPQVSEYKVTRDCWSLMKEERFWLLETLAAKLREQGSLRIGALYKGCRGSDYGGERVLMRALCDRWLETLAGSPTAAVVLADSLTVSAWEARGGGWGRDVTEEGRQKFSQDLELAAKRLDKDSPPDDHACASRITIAMGLNQPRGTVDKLVEQAGTIDPLGAEALGAKAIYLLPRWHGGEGELSTFAGQLAKSRDPAALARLLGETDSYFDGVLEELPYPMVDLSLKAAENAKTPYPGVFETRLRVEKFYGHADKLPAAVAALVASPDRYRQYESLLRAYQKDPRHVRDAATATVVQSGQYADVLPAPTLLASKGPFPLVPGRSLGMRLRYGRDIPVEQWKTISLTRPDPKTGEQVTVSRQTWVAPMAMRKGQEELVEWTIDEDQAPGPWMLTVQMDQVTLAQQTFEMRSSDAPPEPGLRLEFQGQTVADRALPTLTPVAPGRRIPMRLGNGFGFMVSFLGKPQSGRFRWIPPDKPASRAIQEDWVDLDCSGVARGVCPRMAGNFFLEAPKELVPGVWRLVYELNGRGVGELSYELKP